MKKPHSFLLRALCLCLILAILASELSLSAIAANEEAPAGTTLVNQYKGASTAIPVNAGDVVYFGPAIPWSVTHLTTFDSAGAPVAEVTLDATTRVDSFGYYNIYSYVVPEGVTSVKAIYARNHESVYMVTVNQTLTAKNFIEYWENFSSRKLKSYGVKFEQKDDSPLQGKSALFMGDSITQAGPGDLSLYHCGWAGRIAASAGMECINAGVSGASVSTRFPDNRVITQMDNYKNRSFDFVIMHGGVNDAWFEAPLGQMSEGTELSDFNITTFAGGLEELFYTAKKNYPEAPLGYIVNYPTTWSEGKLSELDKYMDEAIKICEKWGVSYLDLYHDTNLHKELKIDKLVYLPDRVHPNGLGFDILAPKIETWMEMLATTEPVPEAAPAPETTAAETTAAPVEKGCGSSLSTFSVIAMTITLSGAALLLYRKRRIFE